MRKTTTLSHRKVTPGYHDLPTWYNKESGPLAAGKRARIDRRRAYQKPILLEDDNRESSAPIVGN